MTTDTTPEAAAEQLRLMRQATPRERLAAALDLSEAVHSLAWRGIRRRMPTASEAEIRVEFARIYFDHDLADRIRAELAS